MGNVVVRRSTLDVSQRPADELRVGRKRAVRPEDGGDRDIRVVVPFSEYPHLDNAVIPPAFKIRQAPLTLLQGHSLTSDVDAANPATLIKGDDLNSMADGTGGGNNLMSEAVLALFQQDADALINNGFIAQFRERHASGKPDLLAHLDDFFVAELATLPLNG